MWEAAVKAAEVPSQRSKVRLSGRSRKSKVEGLVKREKSKVQAERHRSGMRIALKVGHKVSDFPTAMLGEFTQLGELILGKVTSIQRHIEFAAHFSAGGLGTSKILEKQCVGTALITLRNVCHHGNTGALNLIPQAIISGKLVGFGQPINMAC